MVIFFRLRDNVIDRRLFLTRTIAHKITVCVIILSVLCKLQHFKVSVVTKTNRMRSFTLTVYIFLYFIMEKVMTFDGFGAVFFF